MSLFNHHTSLLSVSRQGKEIFTICISNDYTVYTFGNSTQGAHGFENAWVFPPKQIPNLSNINSISAGLYHVLCLDFNGNVFSFGGNDNGQLGIGNKQIMQTHIPQNIIISSSIKQVSCGELFSICLSDNGYLFSFGANNYGQLGLNHTDNVYSPQKITLDNIECIVCGGNHSISKTYDDIYYSWGNNGKYQLGKESNSEAIKSINKPTECNNWPNNIIDIKCGFEHTLLLTLEGQVYSFGCNYYGQLGINDKNIKSINKPTLILDIPEIQRIECGSKQSLCIDINNNLWLFGNNTLGQLGLGDKEHKYKPTLHQTLLNVIDISSGGYTTFVKTIDNKIYAFGHNNNKQLGIKTSNNNQLTPIQVLEDKEDIWCSFIAKSKAKSARK